MNGFDHYRDADEDGMNRRDRDTARYIELNRSARRFTTMHGVSPLQAATQTVFGEGPKGRQSCWLANNRRYEDVAGKRLSAQKNHGPRSRRSRIDRSKVYVTMR